MIRVPRQIGMIARICTDESARYALSGVKVEGRGEKATLTASDGKRIVEATVRGVDHEPAHEGENSSFVVYKKVFEEAAKGCGRLKAGLGKTHFEISAAGDPLEVRLAALDDRGTKRSLVSRAIDGNYPETTSVFPKSEPIASITMNPRLLGETLLALDAMKDGKWATVKLHIHDEPKVGLLISLEMKSETTTFRSVVMGVSR